MTKPQITIIGLGLIGGSIGLGLTASAKEIHIVGHDIDARQSRLARKKGAVHESKLNLIDACKDADLVIVATPILAIQETLELIGPHLNKGCVVTDTATLKEPVLAWAAETLPAGVSFVGGDPLLSPDVQPTELEPMQGLELARPDLFQKAFYFLCAPPETPPTAVKRVTDMTNLLQARPFFLDPAEHDGMRAAVEGLPMLTSLALMTELSDAPGWQEARKLADHLFRMTTVSLVRDAEIQREKVLLNAAYLVPRLDSLIKQLTQLREWITQKDAAALEEAFDRASTVRARWLTEQTDSDWQEGLSELGVGGTFGSLKSALGFGSRPQEPKEE